MPRKSDDVIPVETPTSFTIAHSTDGQGKNLDCSLVATIVNPGRLEFNTEHPHDDPAQISLFVSQGQMQKFSDWLIANFLA